ncbi:MAG: DUF4125 family protein [Lachnospiraceae bacterium]|nr:DUF4125 family protein [Lachnospiraceae bacterium]
MIDTNEITKELDRLFEQNQMNQVEPFLTQKLIEAMQEEDTAAVLILLNEMMGFFRSTNQYDKSLLYAQKAVAILKGADMEGTVEYATTLLNYANAMRAAGKLPESIALYAQTEKIYNEKIPEGAFDFANLYNNLSLVYMEMQRYEEAIGYLRKALAIVEQYREQKAFELAVTHTNLGNCLLQLPGRQQEAVGHLNKALAFFESAGLYDTHYGAAVMGIGDSYEKKGDYQEAIRQYRKGMDAISRNLGFIEYYYRVRDKYRLCLQKAEAAGIHAGFEKGIILSEALWEEVLQPEMEKNFPELMKRAAVGLVGYGSDCYGYDDDYSRDHDWGPAVCIWLGKQDYEQCGEKLQSLYDSLTTGLRFRGFDRQNSPQGQGRVGVLCMEQFAAAFLGKPFAEFLMQQIQNECADLADNSSTLMDFEEVTDRIRNRLSVSEQYRTYLQMTDEVSLSALVNGKLFSRGDGRFEMIRSILAKGYPGTLRYLKLAQSGALYSQNLQYNLRRTLVRGDYAAARLMLEDGLRNAYELTYLIQNEYHPHAKWLAEGLRQSEIGREVLEYIERIEGFFTELICRDKETDMTEQRMGPLLGEADRLAQYLIRAMQEERLLGIGRFGTGGIYMEDMTQELTVRAEYEALSEKELVEAVVKLEWEAFDRVQNEGGRADCQDDWNTFSLMRRSQYNVWTRQMLIQYATDFTLADRAGWNLITEKYGRMEQSTAPQEWEKIKDRFPVIDERKAAIIEEIVKIQVAWMEEFAAEYPMMATNARSIHTSEDSAFNTSYETYLRGEISTYSDTMLSMYGQFIVGLSGAGGNLAYRIMEQTALLYGYRSLEDAETRLKA